MPQYTPTHEDEKKELAALRVLFYKNLTPAAYVTTDGYFTKVNEAWCKLVKIPKSVLEGGMRWQDITFYEDIAPDQGMVDRVLKGEVGEYDNWKTYRTGDGGEQDVYLHVQPVFNDDGTVDFFVSQALAKDKIPNPGVDAPKTAYKSNQKQLYSTIYADNKPEFKGLLKAITAFIAAVSAYILTL